MDTAASNAAAAGTMRRAGRRARGESRARPLEDRRPRRRSGAAGRIALLALCAGLVAASPAMAHRGRAGSRAGLPVPGLTHGQMAVIAEHRAAILDLADREPIQDETFQRLRNFAAIQFMVCLWGAVPGSVTDEASPFNECSHAYLAAAQALLLHIEATPGNRDVARALSDQINREMIQRGAALLLCRHSEEPFNTADVVSPDWNAVVRHGPSLLFFLALGALLAGAAAFAVTRAGAARFRSAPSCRSRRRGR